MTNNRFDDKENQEQYSMKMLTQFLWLVETIPPLSSLTWKYVSIEINFQMGQVKPKNKS